MEINYKTNKLKKSVADFNSIKKNYGTMAKLVNTRKSELIAAINLEDMRAFPQANCHELVGNRKGEFAVDISANFRIIFIPDHMPVPKKEDGGIDWTLITNIEITHIGEDYH